ncbi:MAG: hypothetical protein R2932_50570 [Caldilineaceae bacterium]
MMEGADHRVDAEAEAVVEVGEVRRAGGDREFARAGGGEGIELGCGLGHG